MLAKCANPRCETTFRYLREGKLFVFPATQKRSTGPNPGRSPKASRLDYYWLCHPCSDQMEVHSRDGGGVLLVHVSQPQEKRRVT